jgi:hypothetical protein
MGAGWKPRLAVLCAALWWGSLTTTGFLVVPLLFAHLPTPALAGQMAARLFSAQTWVALACGMLLMMTSRSRGETARMDWAGGALLYVAAGMLLAVLVEFAIAPRIMARDNLRLWHSIGSGMYLLQWLCAGIVLWRVSAGSSAALRSDGLS